MPQTDSDTLQEQEGGLWPGVGTHTFSKYLPTPGLGIRGVDDRDESPMSDPRETRRMLRE